MKTYELTYIISSELTREEIETIVKGIESFIQENEGIILKYGSPIAKTLSYSTRGLSSGFFNVLDFQLEPEKLNGLKEKIEKEVKIIRHMLVVKNSERKFRSRREKRKFDFAPESKTSKIESLNKEEFSFASPFASVSSENSKNQKHMEDEKTADNSDNKKTAEDKPEKVELKDIEEKLDEILGK